MSVPHRRWVSHCLRSRGCPPGNRSEYETTEAVRDVSLEVCGGEALALVGESAVDKRMIGHAILGLLPGNTEMRADAVRFCG
jgi:ABC-type microcin C transport system duplicated ATPase subunit YejF